MVARTNAGAPLPLCPPAGDILRIVEDIGEDGFCVAEMVGGPNAGRQGFAPSNYLCEATEEEENAALDELMRMNNIRRPPSVIMEEPEAEAIAEAASNRASHVSPAAAAVDHGADSSTDAGAEDLYDEVSAQPSPSTCEEDAGTVSPGEPPSREPSVDWAGGYRKTARTETHPDRSISEEDTLERSWVPTGAGATPPEKQTTGDNQKYRVGRKSRDLDLGDSSDLLRRDELARQHAAKDKQKELKQRQEKVRLAEAARVTKKAEKERLAELHRERVRREQASRAREAQAKRTASVPGTHDRRTVVDEAAEKRNTAMATAAAQRLAAKAKERTRQDEAAAAATKEARKEDRRKFLESVGTCCLALRCDASSAWDSHTHSDITLRSFKKVQEERDAAAAALKAEQEDKKSADDARKAAEAAEASRRSKAKQRQLFEEREVYRAEQRAAAQQAKADAIIEKRDKYRQAKEKQARLQRARTKRLEAFKLRKQEEEAAVTEWISGALVDT